MGEIHVQLKEYDKALTLHKQVLALYKELGNRQKEAETIGHIGNAYFQAGQYSQVEELFRHKLETIRKLGDREGERLILEVMRRYLKQDWRFRAGHYACAASKDVYTRFLEGNMSWSEVLEISKLNLFINRELHDSFEEALSLHGIGWSYRNLGQYNQALKFYQQALDIQHGKRLDEEAFFLVDIGIVYSDLGQYEQALNYLQQSLRIRQQIRETIDDAHYQGRNIEHFALNQIGLVYKKLGQYERALQFLQQALLKASSSGGHVFDEHNILNNLGSVYFELGEYSKSLKSYQQALDLDVLGEPGAKGFRLNNIQRTQRSPR
jgi:tetratricopeptide (TPR) repeat protein